MQSLSLSKATACIGVEKRYETKAFLSNILDSVYDFNCETVLLRLMHDLILLPHNVVSAYNYITYEAQWCTLVVNVCDWLANYYHPVTEFDLVTNDVRLC